jgi:HPt (histidine-containing phosphotransfer) domain-containing protein
MGKNNLIIILKNNIEFKILHNIILSHKKADEINILRLNAFNDITNFSENDFYLIESSNNTFKEKLKIKNLYTFTRPYKTQDILDILSNIITEIEKTSSQNYNVIDIYTFKEYMDDAPVHAIIELIDEFTSKKELQLEEIKKAIQDISFEHIRENTHKFKGIVSFFHAKKITQLFIDLQKSAENRDINKCRELFAEILNNMDLLTNDITKLKKDLISKN